MAGTGGGDSFPLVTPERGGSINTPAFPLRGQGGVTPPPVDTTARQQAGSIWGRSASTPNLVAARFSEANRLNVITLTPSARGAETATNTYSTTNCNQASWTNIVIDRPTILWLTGYKNDGTSSTISGVEPVLSSTYPGSSTANIPPVGEVLYAPHAPPRSESEAIRSVRRGVVYLPNPGIWWLKLSGWKTTVFDTVAHRDELAITNPGVTIDSFAITNANARAAAMDFLQVDASDPAIASAFLSLPGANGCTTWRNSNVSTSVLLVPANPYRKALTISPVSGSIAIRLGVGRAASGTLGMRIPTSGFTFTFAGDALFLGELYVAADGGVGPASVEALEYF